MSIYIQREREKNDQLSLNCSGTERQEGGWGAEGVKAKRVGWGLQKGGGIYLSVMDKRAGERGQFQSRVYGIVVGGGRGEGWRSIPHRPSPRHALERFAATHKSSNDIL